MIPAISYPLNQYPSPNSCSLPGSCKLYPKQVLFWDPNLISNITYLKSVQHKFLTSSLEIVPTASSSPDYAKLQEDPYYSSLWLNFQKLTHASHFFFFKSSFKNFKTEEMVNIFLNKKQYKMANLYKYGITCLYHWTNNRKHCFLNIHNIDSKNKSTDNSVDPSLMCTCNRQ